MDLDGFREPQSPWFFSQPPTYLTETRVQQLIAPKKNTDPTMDNRFPGWAAPMEDARLVTDYRPKCAVNIPAGEQFATRKFLQKNADSIIQQSRNRQAEKTGAGMAFDSRTDIPTQSIVFCTPDECGYQPNVLEGVGTSRSEPVPTLFGTFAMSRASFMEPAKPSLTQRQEGGRNSIRGMF